MIAAITTPIRVFVQKRLSFSSFERVFACTAAMVSPKSRTTSPTPTMATAMAARPKSAGSSNAQARRCRSVHADAPELADHRHRGAARGATAELLVGVVGFVRHQAVTLSSVRAVPSAALKVDLRCPRRAAGLQPTREGEYAPLLERVEQLVRRRLRPREPESFSCGFALRGCGSVPVLHLVSEAEDPCLSWSFSPGSQSSTSAG